MIEIRWGVNFNVGPDQFLSQQERRNDDQRWSRRTAQRRQSQSGVQPQESQGNRLSDKNRSAFYSVIVEVVGDIITKLLAKQIFND